MRLRFTALAVLTTSALLAVACSRTPPEPAPASTTTSAAIATEQPSSRLPNPNKPNPNKGRCITETPEKAPPIPAAASPSACPPDPEGIPKLNTAQVAFPEATGNPKVDVELVKSEQEVQRGLMYRMSMPEDHGMLFKMSERTDHTFWMHNTCMALDMLFVDDDGTVVGIVEGAAPLTDSTRSVGCPSSWVLETNAGWCRRHGVRAGQKMGIPSAAR
jgi:uncharacterized membrane protein (UPF0127 family)